MPPVTTAETKAQEAEEQAAATAAAILKERRFKLSRACDRCRRRRIKCDEGHPCQACLTASSACTFEEPGKRSHPHKSKRTATLEDRMHHLEQLIQAIPPAVFEAGGSSMPYQTPSDTSLNSTMPFTYPQLSSGVPPPSLHVFPLTNPSTHFLVNSPHSDRHSSPNAAFHSLMGSLQFNNTMTPDQLADETSRMSLSASYLYFDDEGYTRWQGETSGLPLLDLFLEKHTQPKLEPETTREVSPGSPTNNSASESDWFPNRVARPSASVNPEVLWRLITSYIAPELMDSLVQCFLSTSYYVLPFLHIPTFLADYGNPQKWGEPGFATFIVSICCLASRHMDDPRVRANPADGISAGTQWFELLGRLRTLPISDRPTLYTIQANLLAAVYACGLGRLSKAAALLSEAITVSIDAGLHRSADTYDIFDPIEDQVRKRTFWCVYIWDKQLGAHFGRPAMIRLRDCDIEEPLAVDDEYITKDGVGVQPPGSESRMSAFICALRILVVLESVLDISPQRHPDTSSSFLLRAASVLSRPKGFNDLRDEEALLDEIRLNTPPWWAHTAETLATDDPVRLTQAVRLHCADHFVRLLIYRHRFTHLVAIRNDPMNICNPEEQTDAEKDAVVGAHNSALMIITAHLNIATKGLMTYYGVHVIHQLTQAGRTLVAILLNCQTDPLKPLIPTGLDALRSCVGLLRRFSGRYVCGLRSGDLMEEFCRLTQIPLDANSSDVPTPRSGARPAWLRPVRKKAISLTRSNKANSNDGSSPESFPGNDTFFSDPSKPMIGLANNTPIENQRSFSNPGAINSSPSLFMDSAIGLDMGRTDSSMFMSPSDVMALFNENGVDVAMFNNPDFNRADSLSSDAPSGFANTPPFIKMDGLVASP